MPILTVGTDSYSLLAPCLWHVDLQLVVTQYTLADSFDRSRLISESDSCCFTLVCPITCKFFRPFLLEPNSEGDSGKPSSSWPELAQQSEAHHCALVSLLYQPHWWLLCWNEVMQEWIIRNLLVEQDIWARVVGWVIWRGFLQLRRLDASPRHPPQMWLTLRVGP